MPLYPLYDSTDHHFLLAKQEEISVDFCGFNINKKQNLEQVKYLQQLFSNWQEVQLQFVPK